MSNNGRAIPDREAMLLHRRLALYHHYRAVRTRLALLYNYHQDMAWRLDHEADRIESGMIIEGSGPRPDDAEAGP
jgi:hypothetical protein